MNKMIAALACLMLSACGTTTPEISEKATPQCFGPRIDYKPKFKTDDQLTLTLPSGQTFHALVLDATEVKEFRVNESGLKQMSQGYMVIVHVENKVQGSGMIILEVPEFALSR